MRDIDRLFFDLDGTLTDSKEGILNSIRHAFGQIGYDLPSDETLMGFIGPPLMHSFAALMDEETAQNAVDHFRQRYDVEGKGIVENTLYPDIIDVLTKLKNRGLILSVVTSKPQEIAQQIVSHFDLAPFFTRVYGPNHDGGHDKADLIAHALAEEKAVPSRTVMIGDRKFDILGAVKNEMRSIGAGWGYGAPSELQEAGATIIVAKPRGLLEILGD